MAKPGRPTKYKTELCEELVTLMAQGWHNDKICSVWDIDRDTFYEWKNKHKEFEASYNRGLPKKFTWWTEWGEKGMKGEVQGFEFKPWIAFMNQFPEWVKNGQSDPRASINIGNINVLNQLQAKPIDQLKDILLEKLGSQGIIEYTPIEVNDHTKDNDNKTKP